MFCLLLIVGASFCWGDDDKPYGIAKRAAWRTSKVTGSPEPPAAYRIERIYPQLAFDQPVAMIAGPEKGQTFLVERKGKIFLLSDDPTSRQREVFLDGRQAIDDLNAVYGLAFHPEFKKNRFCYVCYILKPNLPQGTRVSRFRVTETSWV